MAFSAFYFILPLIVGITLPFQPVINARVSEVLGHPLWGTAVNFTVGFVFVMALMLAARIPLPALGAVASVPWWGWLGGFIGAFLVTVSLWCVPKIGVALTMALLIAGQMLASILLDHFKVLPNTDHPLTMLRLMGAAFIVLGVILILKF